MTRVPALRLAARLRRLGLVLATLALGAGMAAAQVTVAPNVLQPRNSIVIDRTTPRATILRQLQAGTVTRVPIERTERPRVPVTLPQGSQRPIPLPGPRPSPMPTPHPAPEATLLMPVQFDYDSDRLRPEARAMLDVVADALRDPSLGAAVFLVEGHTDATGSWEYNQNLSERRALSVARYLVSRGVPQSSLIPVGYSWNRLLASLHPTDARHRRVEIGRLAE